MTVWGKERDRNSRFQNNPIKTAGERSWAARREGWDARSRIIAKVDGVAAGLGSPTLTAVNTPICSRQRGVLPDVPLSCHLGIFSLSLFLVV